MASRNHRGGEVHYAANKYGFLLKGLVRCGECGSAVVPYVRPKKGKAYLYYRCIGQNTGQGKKCTFTSIGARKLEEFVVEKLAAIGWDRPFLEKVLGRAQKLANQSIAPLEAEKRQLQEHLTGLQGEIQGLLNMAKAGGNSQEIANELRRLEGSKAEITARIARIDAATSHRRQAIYDVDTVLVVFKRFALFINRIPVEMKVQIIRLMVEQVIVSASRIEVKMHELSVGGLRKALDKSVVLRREAFAERRGLNTPTKEKSHPNRVAFSEQNVRGRRDLNPRSLP